MSVRTMVKKLNRLEALARRRNVRNAAVLAALAADPVRILTDAGMEPDTWQTDVLRSDATRLLLLASRQAGKSSVAAALALRTALLRPRAPVLLLNHSRDSAATPREGTGKTAEGGPKEVGAPASGIEVALNANALTPRYQ